MFILIEHKEFPFCVKNLAVFHGIINSLLHKNYIAREFLRVYKD